MTKAGADVDPTIRDATLADAAALASLMGELGYETGAEEMSGRLQSILPDAPYKTLVAVLNGKVCGMIGTISHSSYMHNDLSGKIVALVVSEATRRHGIARQLVESAEKDFARRNIKRITLTTRLTREDAHRFYEQLGYTRNGFRYAKELRLAGD